MAHSDAADGMMRAQARERLVLQESFRYLEHAPVSILVVHGDDHRAIYANSAFREASGLSDADINSRPIAEILAGHTVLRPNHPHRADVVALLDRVRAERIHQSDFTVSVKVSANVSVDVGVGARVHPVVTPGESGSVGVWRCKVWPVEWKGAWIDQLIVELWHAPDDESTLIRQREIAERMLLSALREQALSEDNVRLYDAANAARAAAEQAQWRAEEAQHQAEAANSAKAEFLANMSHELRTPLNAISGYAQLIELGLRGPVTEAQIDDLRRIQRSEAHLLGLINSVLNYAKLEAGQVSYDLQDFVFRDVLVGAESLVFPQLRAKNLAYAYVDGVDHSDATEAAPFRVVADAEKVMQILLNLITNAIKFTDPGGHVRVASWMSGERAYVSVTDDGRGIPVDMLETIFDPFVQVGRTLSSGDTGVGLGLAISRELAIRMAGDLTADSVEGEGSTFTLTLPLAP